MELDAVWVVFYSGVVSFQYHPGTKEKLSLVECAFIADKMLEQYQLREDVWRGSSEAQLSLVD